MDMDQLAAELEVMHALQAGTTVIIASLIATHPDYAKFQLHLAGILEVADAGALFAPLTQPQRKLARDYVEHLQQTREATSTIDPLGSILGRSASKPPSA